MNKIIADTQVATDYKKEDTRCIIVEVDGESVEAEQIIGAYGKIKGFLPMINSYIVEVEKARIFEIRHNSKISAVYENTTIQAQMNNGKRTVFADNAHYSGYSGNGVAIAFLDTGISLSDDFTFPRNRVVAFKDFINNKQRPYDDNGHGTHVQVTYPLHFISLKLAILFAKILHSE